MFSNPSPSRHRQHNATPTHALTCKSQGEGEAGLAFSGAGAHSTHTRLVGRLTQKDCIQVRKTAPPAAEVFSPLIASLRVCTINGLNQLPEDSLQALLSLLTQCS
ncbi:hypothetical protein GOP47_0006440 [Adiantum capillus-veneris]|uniref:Uncharacterized protein n=1 Tax=Adiantum capillus-veneris TaxID=13818 RepID=A0A9D4V3A1_ADICA|nr:hypothetical protein GOP47_0006440 [Adiantum capillus-veneris]